MQCPVCHEWIVGAHACSGKPLPKVGAGYQCPTCREWVSGRHVCSGRPLPKLDPPKSLKAYAAQVYPAQQVAMETDPVARIVPLDDRKLWDFALSNFLIAAPSNKADRDRLLNEALADMTVQQFAGKPAPERIAIINKLWDAIVEWVAPNQTAQQMMDPDAGNAVHNVTSTRLPRAFSRFGIGFRCEKDTDLQRILDHGFKPLYSLPDIAAQLGHVVRGTVMQVKTGLGQLGLWKVNQDAIGQTGICVSRGALGASKFPEATHTGDVYMFAVRPTNLGYDTETYQDRKGPDKVWKPGEKLFPSISKADVLAYVKIKKLGMDGFGTGWKIQAENAWTFVAGTAEERAYITAELQDLQTPGGRAFLLVKASQYDFHQPQ